MIRFRRMALVSTIIDNIFFLSYIATFIIFLGFDIVPVYAKIITFVLTSTLLLSITLHHGKISLLKKKIYAFYLFPYSSFLNVLGFVLILFAFKDNSLYETKHLIVLTTLCVTNLLLFLISPTRDAKGKSVL